MTARLPYARAGDSANRSASVQNALVAGARRSLAEDFTSPDFSRVTADPSLIRLHNTTGDDLDRWQVVALGDVTIDPAADLQSEFSNLDEPTFDMLFPPENIHRGRFAVLVEPIADGRIGFGKVCDLAYVLVADDVEAGDWVDIDESSRADEGILEWFPFGSAHVLWCGAVASTLPATTKLALVRLTNTPGPTKIQGLLAQDLDPADDSIDSPTTAIVTLILGNPAELSSRTIEATNRSIDASAESLTYVGLTYDAHLKEVCFDWIDCNPDEISTSSDSGGGTPPAPFGGGVYGGGTYGSGGYGF